MVVLDRLDACSNLKNLEEVAGSDQFTFVKGDVTDLDLVNHLLEANEVDTILHFAAEVG